MANKRRRYYYSAVGQSTCTVSFLDSHHVRHSVEVTAESLFKAAVLALKVFRAAKPVDCAPGPASVLDVKVSARAVIHTVSIRRVQEWLDSSGKTPREQALKHRLRGMLDDTGAVPQESH